ncbi:MAG: choice-of-anchor B family protein [Saprospiraceae bacterium]|nr:choice-of-anchor B family protein [Saprospiraceae bacterium]
MDINIHTSNLRRIICFSLFIALSCCLELEGQSCPPPQSDDLIVLDHMDHPSTSAFSDLWGYASGGKEYAIIGRRDSIFIEDVTDPYKIQTVVSIWQGDISTWRDFKVYGDYLYSITDNGTNTFHGVVIYDLSNLPLSAPQVNSLTTEFGRCHNIFIDEANARLYAVGMPGAMDICVYELTDPANPTLWGCYDLDTISSGTNTLYIHDIFVKDNIAYCGHGYSGYFIWDMNDKNNVDVIGSLPSSFFDGGYVHSSWNFDNDDKAVVATEIGGNPGIYIVDQSVPTAPVKIAQWKQPLHQCQDAGNLDRKRPHNPYVLGNKAYISFYHDGVQVLDLNTLTLDSYYDTYPENDDYSSGFPGCWGVYPYLPSGTIIASDRSHGLFTLIPGACNTLVAVTDARGPGTLDAGIACAEDGGTVTLSGFISGQTINFQDIGQTIRRNLIIEADPVDNITLNASGNNPIFHVLPGVSLTLRGFTIQSSSSSTQAIINEGILILDDMTVIHNAGQDAIRNTSSGQMSVTGDCNIEN